MDKKTERDDPGTVPQPEVLFQLESLNVLSLPALGALYDIELNGLAFLERTETIALNGGVMYENIVACCTAEKSEALGIVEPLYCTLFHDIIP